MNQQHSQHSQSHSMFYIILIAIIIGCIWTTFHDLKVQAASPYKSITVKKGDTLWSLGEQYKGKLTMSDFISWVEEKNGLGDRNDIQEGEALLIPVKGEGALDSSSQVAGVRSPGSR